MKLSNGLAGVACFAAIIGAMGLSPSWAQEVPVGRQSFWNQWRPKLRESLAHLVGLIMRRVVCVASGALRASFV
ncbi:MAG: hypothetical protein ABJ360_11975 [Roseobacter sp.]